MKSVLNFDKALLHLVNYKWHNDFFDLVLPFLRESAVWLPFYLFFSLFAIINYKKNGWWFVAFAGATVIISNYISSDLIKGNIIRLRPCNDPSLADWLRVLAAYRPQSSSFTSSHAANHFALAMFLYTTLKKQFGNWMFLIFLWAFSICYAQVYVGVHYPLDILGGTIVGLLVGWGVATIFNKKFELVIIDSK